MRNKKGNTIGVLILLFLGIIVAASLLPTIAENQQLLTNKQPRVNETVSLATDDNGGWGFNPGIATTDQGINTSSNHTLARGPSGTFVDGWQHPSTDNPCPIENVVARNQSGTAYTVTTDYLIDNDYGMINYLNTSAVYQEGLETHNTTLVTYDYCDDGYGTSSGTRGVARLILIFAALGLVGYAIYYALGKSGLIRA